MVEPKKGQTKRLILWSEVMELVRKIKAQVTTEVGYNLKYNSIYGIPRGGQVVAVLLSHQLGLPIVDRTGINMHTLIVDDISDSGNTLNDASHLFKVKWDYEMKCAVLHQRPGTMYEAYFIGETIKDEWIVYPWEVE